MVLYETCSLRLIRDVKVLLDVLFKSPVFIVTIKIVCASKDTRRKYENNPQSGGKILQIIYLMRDLSRYIKN